MTESSQQQRPQPTQTAINKTNPGANDRKFIPFPNNALHYIHHDKMNADKLFLYALLIDRFNVEKGAAWPSHETLAVVYGKSSKTVGKHLSDLKDAGLIAIPSKGRYVPLEPLCSGEFYGKHPTAWANYQQALKVSDQRKEADRERWAEYREKTRGTRT